MADTLDILHVFRAPVGGLFRHVRDLALAQSRAGHRVGLLCDASTGGDMAERRLRELEARLAHGVRRIAMPRLPGTGDVAAIKAVRAHVRERGFHVAHGHGAKGGLYARLLPARTAARIYTAHGGSLHYQWRSPSGALFLATERLLLARTDGLVFVCDYERAAFADRIGRFGGPQVVAHNGLPEEEFAPVPLRDDAAEVLFIGEMRLLKGVDVLLAALALLHAQGSTVRAVLVGDGPDRARFQEQARQLGLNDHVLFPGPMPAREAFALGRVMVVPSRAESFPYVVLEALAAGKPVIASDIGGIPEMLAREHLVPPGDAPRLAEALAVALRQADDEARTMARIAAMRERFALARMADRITGFYHTALTKRGAAAPDAA